MSFVAVDKDGAEAIYMNPPYRNSEDWNPLQFPDGSDTYWVYLPKGSIKKLIGRELTWEDDPVELKGE